MAEHQYHVRKYGIDGASSPDQEGGTGIGGRSSSLSSEGEDWDRLMDDTVSNVSFCSTAIVGSAKKSDYCMNMSRTSQPSPSPDRSVDVSSSFFDKSIIQSLLTPEKIRAKQSKDEDEENAIVGGVTLSRGRVHDSSDSLCCSTNVSSCTGVEEMFHAALRFHDDLLQSSFTREDDSIVVGRSDKDKSSSVSFAADTSFATNDSRFMSRRKGHRKVQENEHEEVTLGLDFLSASPIHNNNKDDSFAVDSSFFGSPISPAFSRVGEKSTILRGSPPSSTLTTPRGSPLSSALTTPRSSPRGRQTTPLRSGKQVTIGDQTTFASLLGLTPEDQPRSSPPSETQSAVPSSPFDACSKKNLFPSEIEEEVEIDSSKKILFHSLTAVEATSIEYSITHDSIELIRNTPSRQDYVSRVLSEGSSYLNLSSSTASVEEVPVSQFRSFGTNATFRLNQVSVTNNNSPEKLIPIVIRKTNALNGNAGASYDRNVENFMHEENRRGVRLSRVSKLKALGLERVCSLRDNQPSEQQGDRSDF